MPVPLGVSTRLVACFSSAMWTSECSMRRKRPKLHSARSEGQSRFHSISQQFTPLQTRRASVAWKYTSAEHPKRACKARRGSLSVRKWSHKRRSIGRRICSNSRRTICWRCPAWACRSSFRSFLWRSFASNTQTRDPTLKFCHIPPRKSWCKRGRAAADMLELVGCSFYWFSSWELIRIPILLITLRIPL